MYEAVRDFVDIQDNNHIYRMGDKFPHDGAKASKSRIAELASTENKCGVVLIKAIEKDNKSSVSEENEVNVETVARSKKSPKKKKEK